MNKYQIKNIKTLNTRDGVALTANLYRDGKIIATIEDRADGGAIRIHFGLGDEASLLEAWGKQNCAGHWSEKFMGDSTMDQCELAVEILIEIAQNDKDAKKNIIMRVRSASDFDSDIYKVEDYKMRNTTIADMSALMKIMYQYPKAEVWDSNTQAFIAVSKALQNIKPVREVANV